MKTLYEIREDHLTLIDELDTLINSGEEITPEQMDAINSKLEINSKEFQEKAEAYAAVIAQKMAEARFLKDEAKKLIARAKAAENTADRLNERIAFAMDEQGIEKIELPHFRLRFHKSSSVQITDDSLLPKQFVKEKTVSEPDKKAIKEAIDAGVEVPGAKIQNNKSLIIK